MENIDIGEFSEMIQNLLGDYLKPKIFDAIDTFNKKAGKKKELISHTLFENKFKAYLENKVAQFLVIDTLVFPNYQTLIRTVYEPVYINTEYENIGKVLIDKYPKSLFENLFRIMIQDTAGMGKSTITRIMFLDAVNSTTDIPFHIELRKINSENTILAEICDQLNLLDNSKEELELVKELIRKGDFIFFLDGYDEVAFDDREEVSDFIHELLALGDGCKFCLTSRPEAGLTSFGDFISFSISELTKEQASSIFRRLDTYAFKPIAEKLNDAIDQSKRKGNENIGEFLGNPLLASLLYKTFDFKKNLPDNLSQFYRQIYDALFENHDLSKEGYFKRDKFSKLHIDDFEKILRCIGFQTSLLGRNEFTKDQLIRLVEKSNKFFPDIKFNPSDFIKDITSTVPLFKIEGLTFKWSHKSLQDYFGAKFLYSDFNEKRDKTLLKFFNRCTNNFLLKIYNSLDSKTFRKICVKSFLDDYIDYSNQQFQLLKKSESESTIISWIGFSYASKIQFAYMEPDDFDVDSLNALIKSEEENKPNFEARKKWYEYLRITGNSMTDKMKTPGPLSQRGPLCKKYIYQLEHTWKYSKSVLFDIYPELFDEGGITEDNSNHNNICKSVSKLKEYKVHSLEEREKMMNSFKGLSELLYLDILLLEKQKVAHQKAFDLHRKITDEIESAKILDELF